MENVVIYQFPLGSIICYKSKSSRTEHKSTSKRSKIMTFSHKSSNRLKSLVIQSFQNKPLLGVTLTTPLQLPLERFKALRRSFFQQIRRFRQSIRLIYRVELQQNGNPHIHFITDTLDVDFIHYVEDEWNHYFKSSINLNYTVDFQLVRAAQGFNYLIAHTSKHKQAQLGYAGRQWGAIGCDSRLHPTSVFELNGDYYKMACRTFSSMISKKYARSRRVKLNQKFHYFYNQEFQQVLKAYSRLQYETSCRNVKSWIKKETMFKIYENSKRQWKYMKRNAS